MRALMRDAWDHSNDFGKAFSHRERREHGSVARAQPTRKSYDDPTLPPVPERPNHAFKPSVKK
jgi:hypothetical protein